MRILSLDASSTTIGLAVLDCEGLEMRLTHVEYYKPSKTVDIFESLAGVRQFIQDKIKEFSPDEIALEDIILFMKGKSTAKTTTTLAVLNRTVGLAVYNQTGRPPCLLNVTRIRHQIKTEKTAPKKEEIPELLANLFKIPFPYVYISRGKNKGNIAPESYDMSDSIAVGVAYYKLNHLPKPVKPKKAAKVK